MLLSLRTKGIGPAPRFDLPLGTRLNVLTGDNGLGKSFVLDLAWYAMTGTWAGQPALPRADTKGSASVRWTLRLRSGKTTQKESRWEAKKRSWGWPGGRPPMAGLTVYARVDGGFSVWDPARNYWRNAKALGVDDSDRPDAYHFGPDELWNGLRGPPGKIICRGLIEDWITWQLKESAQKQSRFHMLRRVLKQLSPPGEPMLEPGEPMRIAVDDSREHPTLRMPYGDVPLVHASAGIRRVLGLAYLIVWAWSEHEAARKLLKQPAENRVVLLVDEVETHLHPRWQRDIVASLLKVVEDLGAENAHLQVLLTTHSPLVLAAMEPSFNEKTDRLFHFRLEEGDISLENLDVYPRGDASAWLTSEVFDLEEARSIEAEDAMRAAEDWLGGKHEGLPARLSSFEQIDAELRKTVPGDDPFWIRWALERERVEGGNGSVRSG
ncbi:ATP-binding protein [Archangium sp.]|jgi:hypothetical protein|uniref:AAA family ATPase n=1 Tax=Archangium sp. TaxID=1872627 RepID=UPI002ED93DD0